MHGATKNKRDQFSPVNMRSNARSTICLLDSDDATLKRKSSFIDYFNELKEQTMEIEKQ